MKLVLTRKWFTDNETLGELKIYDTGGKLLYECFSLEDKTGDYGKGCAIPCGTYKVILTFSQRFQKMLPLLVGIKGRTGIRIHSGNTNADTTGCILVGEQRGDTMIFKSRPALAWVLFHINNAVEKKEDVVITIQESHNDGA